MRPSPERLSEIDRELDALGKSEDELRAVVERARSWMASAGDLADRDLAALADGAREAVARAASAAKASVQAEAPEPPSSEPPTSVMRAPPSEPAPRSQDIAGLSVDELFADAEPSAPAGSGDHGLADLFDDAPLALPEAAPESALADLFDDEPSAFDPADAQRFDEEVRASQSELGGQPLDSLPLESLPLESLPLESLPLDSLPLDALGDALEPEPPARMPLSAHPPAVDLSPFADEDDEVTSSFSLAHIGQLEAQLMAESAASSEPSGDFELLVDEDVLELDEGDLEDELPDDEPPDGTKPGLISRILGRK